MANGELPPTHTDEGMRAVVADTSWDRTVVEMEELIDEVFREAPAVAPRDSLVIAAS